MACPTRNQCKSSSLPSVLIQLHIQCQGDDHWPLQVLTFTGDRWCLGPCFHGPSDCRSLPSMTGHLVKAFGKACRAFLIRSSCQWLLDLKTGSALKIGQRRKVVALSTLVTWSHGLATPGGRPVLLTSTALSALHPLHHHSTWLPTVRGPPALSYFGSDSFHGYQVRRFLGTSSAASWPMENSCPRASPGSGAPHLRLPCHCTWCPRLHLPSLSVFDAFLHPSHSRSDTSAFEAASLSPLFPALSWLEECQLPAGVLARVSQNWIYIDQLCRPSSLRPVATGSDPA